MGGIARKVTIKAVIQAKVRFNIISFGASI
jgi:hypothetical protein